MPSCMEQNFKSKKYEIENKNYNLKHYINNNQLEIDFNSIPEENKRDNNKTSLIIKVISDNGDIKNIVENTSLNDVKIIHTADNLMNNDNLLTREIKHRQNSGGHQKSWEKDEKINLLNKTEQIIEDNLGADTMGDIIMLLEYIPSAPFTKWDMNTVNEIIGEEFSFYKIESIIKYFDNYQRKELFDFINNLTDNYYEDNNLTYNEMDD